MWREFLNIQKLKWAVLVYLVLVILLDIQGILTVGLEGFPDWFLHHDLGIGLLEIWLYHLILGLLLLYLLIGTYFQKKKKKIDEEWKKLDEEHRNFLDQQMKK